MSKEKPVELIQHVLSTMVLDAVQFFPQNKKKVHSEAHGLLFGLTKETSLECDYAFPVGSVAQRNEMLIQPDEKVDNAVKSAKELFSTSICLGTYHSHPYEESFGNWADPSNGDCQAADYLELPYFFIIAIARNGKTNKSLTIKYGECQASEFTYNPEFEAHDIPDAKLLEHNICYINGEFQKYTFTIHAYKNTGNSLIDVDLISSEAELVMMLNEENIKLDEMTVDKTYRLRKMEYNLRQENKERGQGNLEYHLERMK